MNKVNYDRQVLTDFLLGSLAEAEAERFDELSITDDDFADALKAAENDLIDSYIRSELSGSELKKFKTHYLASPFRREKVNFAESFQIFAEKNIAANDKKSFAEETKPVNGFAAFFSAFNIFTAPNAYLRAGFAAALLILIVFGGWILLKNARFSQPADELQAEQGNFPTNEQNSQVLPTVNRAINSPPEKEIAKTDENPSEQIPKKEQTPRKFEKQTTPPPKVNTAPPKISIASFILAPPLRGNNQIQTVRISPETDYAAVQLELESDDYTTYRVTLVDRSDGKTLWRSGKLKSKTSGENKRLSLRFSAKFLKPQIYSLSVSGISTDGAVENISDYSFRVMQ